MHARAHMCTEFFKQMSILCMNFLPSSNYVKVTNRTNSPTTGKWQPDDAYPSEQIRAGAEENSAWFV